MDNNGSWPASNYSFLTHLLDTNKSHDAADCKQQLIFSVLLGHWHIMSEKETNKGLVVTSLDLLMRTPVARTVEALKGDMTQEMCFP